MRDIYNGLIMELDVFITECLGRSVKDIVVDDKYLEQVIEILKLAQAGPFKGWKKICKQLPPYVWERYKTMPESNKFPEVKERQKHIAAGRALFRKSPLIKVWKNE